VVEAGVPPAGHGGWPRSGSDHSVHLKAIDPAKTSPYVSGMTVKPIITLPDPLLRKASAPVERVDAEIRNLADDMLETMYKAPGVGLAAVQVGVPIRLIVLDTAKDEEEPRPLVLINPEIVTLGSELRLHEEGCLSIPDVRIDIERPASLTLRYIDRNGKAQQMAADGLLATAIQHEIDHLNGKLIIDFLTRLKRDIIIRKFKKQAKAEASA
jgi:peptide deformylase